MGSFNRRSFLAGAGASVAVSPLAFPAIAQNRPIPVGACLEFSGGLELFGNQAKIGLDLAAAEINASGGILGRSVEILYRDNKTDPKTAAERTRELIQLDQALAVVGPITSSARNAMQPAIEGLKTCCCTRPTTRVQTAVLVVGATCSSSTPYPTRTRRRSFPGSRPVG